MKFLAELQAVLGDFLLRAGRGVAHALVGVLQVVSPHADTIEEVRLHPQENHNSYHHVTRALGAVIVIGIREEGSVPIQ